MRYLTGILVLSFCFAVFAAGCNKDESSVSGDPAKSNTDTSKIKGKTKDKPIPQPPKVE